MELIKMQATLENENEKRDRAVEKKELEQKMRFSKMKMQVAFENHLRDRDAVRLGQLEQQLDRTNRLTQVLQSWTGKSLMLSKWFTIIFKLVAVHNFWPGVILQRPVF